MPELSPKATEGLQLQPRMRITNADAQKTWDVLVAEQNNDIADDEIDLAELFRALLSQWFLIGLTTLVGGFLAIYYAVAIAEPKYEASVKFAMEDSASGLSSLGELGAVAALAGLSSGGGGGPAATIEDRITSRDFILNLAQNVELFEDPEFNPPMEEPGLLGQMLVATGISSSAVPSIEAKTETILGVYRKAVSVSTSAEGIIQISFSHKVPERASQIANATMELALQEILEDKKQKSRAQIDYLASELLDVQENLEAATQAIADYAIRNDLASDQELARASAQLVVLRHRQESYLSQLAALEQLLKLSKDGSDWSPAIAERLGTNFPSVRDNEFRRILGWGVERATWSLPPVDVLEGAFSFLTLRNADLEDTITEFESLARRNANSFAELSALEREVTVQKTIYEAMVQQFETKSIADGFQVAIADIFETAVPPLRPETPKKPIVAALGLVLGLLQGIVIALMRRSKRSIVYTQSALAEETGQPIVASKVSGRWAKSNRNLREAFARVQSRINPQLDQVAIELSQDDSARVLFVPTVSKDASAFVSLYVANAISGHEARTAIVDLSDSFTTKDQTERASVGALAGVTVSDALDAFVPASGYSVASLSASIAKLRSEFEQIVIVAPVVGEGAPVAAAVAKDVTSVVTIVRTGKTTRAQLQRINSIFERFPDVRRMLICE